MKIKLAIVIPWFGKDLKGGAEQQAWQLAVRLSQKNIDVTVLTTCSRSFYHSWSKNYYQERTFVESGVTVKRFAVQKRNESLFYEISDTLLTCSEKELENEIIFKRSGEAIYCAENISSPHLLQYIHDYQDDYDYFLLLPYLFPDIIKAASIVSHKAILQPCLHNEGYAYLQCVRDAFYRCRFLFFNSRGEMKLAQKIIGSSVGGKAEVMGEGVEVDFSLLPDKSESPQINKPYIIYLGKRDSGKNVHVLVESFVEYKKKSKSELALVLVGPGKFSYGNEKYDIYDFHLVSEKKKLQLLYFSKALINPSKNESFSRVIYEAWFLKVPVIIQRECEATFAALEDSQMAGWAIQDSGDFESYHTVYSSVVHSTEKELYEKGVRGFEYARSFAEWETVIDKYIFKLRQMKNQDTHIEHNNTLKLQSHTNCLSEQATKEYLFWNFYPDSKQLFKMCNNHNSIFLLCVNFSDEMLNDYIHLQEVYQQIYKKYLNFYIYIPNLNDEDLKKYTEKSKLNKFFHVARMDKSSHIYSTLYGSDVIIMHKINDSNLLNIGIYLGIPIICNDFELIEIEKNFVTIFDDNINYYCMIIFALIYNKKIKQKIIDLQWYIFNNCLLNFQISIKKRRSHSTPMEVLDVENLMEHLKAEADKMRKNEGHLSDLNYGKISYASNMVTFDENPKKSLLLKIHFYFKRFKLYNFFYNKIGRKIKNKLF